ncbi:hypothetical protein Tco_0700480 [Tanacetum coccineum]
MSMFLSNIIGVPIFISSSCGGIPGKLSVLRYSAGYSSSISPLSCSCGSASSKLMYLVRVPVSVFIIVELIESIVSFGDKQWLFLVGLWQLGGEGYDGHKKLINCHSVSTIKEFRYASGEFPPMMCFPGHVHWVLPGPRLLYLVTIEQILTLLFSLRSMFACTGVP